MHVALCGNFSGPVCSTDPVKVSKDVASLLVSTRKKFFCLGLRFFCEWRHKWRTFRPLWPTLPGPGRQPLGGSISLKFSLATKLESKSFAPLIDFLTFLVQKLWSKINKLINYLISQIFLLAQIITFEPETPASHRKYQKTRIVA